jgi:protein CpxP
MTDQTSSSPGPQPVSTPDQKRPRRWPLVLAIALIAGLAGAVTTQAMSHGGFGHGGWHHGGFMGAPVDPAWIEESADRAVRHLAVEIDATAEQQEKLRTIVKGALDDLLPLRSEAREAHQQLHELFTQPTFGRAEIERFRTGQMEKWDTASRRMAEALADAAEILTPEQRSKLGELMPRGSGFWHGRRHRG